MGQAHHHLPGRDHLARFGQGVHHDAVGVGQQHRVLQRIARHAGLGFGRLELGAGRVSRRLHLVVAGCRDGARAAQVAVARFFIRRLARAGEVSRDGVLPGLEQQLQVVGVEAHQWLATAHGLAGVDQPFAHLAGHAKTEIALHARRDHAREAARARFGAMHRDGAHQRRGRARIALRLVGTGAQGQG
ncbi:hypothetical protein D3C85_519820 [compost metagenome]